KKKKRAKHNMTLICDATCCIFGEGMDRKKRLMSVGKGMFISENIVGSGIEVPAFYPIYHLNG
ncbi:hypothetical protein, partial [Escherichia coli]|uniref:hypothetical protein n=1 Tax=Escherichia coli TaxID=562 RepID=UPI001BAEF198